MSLCVWSFYNHKTQSLKSVIEHENIKLTKRNKSTNLNEQKPSRHFLKRTNIMSLKKNPSTISTLEFESFLNETYNAF